MTRNYVALFISIIVVSTALLEGFLGIHGMVVNTWLENAVELKQQMLDVQQLELYNLEQRLEHVWDEAELLDRAKMMGYIQTGETPYFFLNSKEETLYGDGFGTILQTGEDRSDQLAEKTFKGLSLRLNFGLALLVSCVLVVFLKIMGRAHGNGGSSKRMGQGHGK